MDMHQHVLWESMFLASSQGRLLVVVRTTLRLPKIRETDLSLLRYPGPPGRVEWLGAPS